MDGEPELRDAEHNGTTMDNFAGEPAMLTGSQMQELISSSLQAAVDEVAMPTFPDRGSEEGGATASTMPWRPPSQFPNLVNGGTTATNLDVSQTSSEGGRRPSDNDDGGSHRRRRLQGAHYGRHGAY